MMIAMSMNTRRGDVHGEAAIGPCGSVGAKLGGRSGKARTARSLGGGVEAPWDVSSSEDRTCAERSSAHPGSPVQGMTLRRSARRSQTANMLAPWCFRTPLCRPFRCWRTSASSGCSARATTGASMLAHPPARLGITDEYVAVKVFAGQCSGQPTDEEPARVAGVRRGRFAVPGAGVRRRPGGQLPVRDGVLPLGSLAAPAWPLTQDDVLRSGGARGPGGARPA